MTEGICARCHKPLFAVRDDTYDYTRREHIMVFVGWESCEDCDEAEAIARLGERPILDEHDVMGRDWMDGYDEGRKVWRD